MGSLHSCVRLGPKKISSSFRYRRLLMGSVVPTRDQAMVELSKQWTSFSGEYTILRNSSYDQHLLPENKQKAPRILPCRIDSLTRHRITGNLQRKKCSSSMLTHRLTLSPLSNWATNCCSIHRIFQNSLRATCVCFRTEKVTRHTKISVD